MTFLLVGLLCYAFIAWKGYKSIQAEQDFLHSGESFYIPDNKLVYKLQPKLAISWEMMTKEPTQRYKNLTTDENSLRATPTGHSVNEHILFFGCSMTFGDFITDSVTTPWRISEMTDYEVKNFAMSGYGPGHTLEQIQSPHLLKDIRNSKGLALYGFIDNHIDRITYSPACIPFTYSFKKYRKPKSGVVRASDKTFLEQRPVRTYFWAGLQAFSLNGIVLMTNDFFRSPKKYRIAAEVLQAAKKKYLKKFPEGRFVVIIYPDQTNKIIPYLKHLDIKYWDFSRETLLAEERVDPIHPNAFGTKKIARLITSQLESDGIANQ